MMAASGGSPSKLERLAAGFGAAGEDDGARIEQAFGGESVDHGGFIADAGEGAGLFVVGGDEAEREVVAAGGDEVADFAGEQGFTADEGDVAWLSKAGLRCGGRWGTFEAAAQNAADADQDAAGRHRRRPCPACSSLRVVAMP